MSRITAIQPTQRDPNRAMVRVDGKVVVTLPLSLIESLGLTVDQAWDATLAGQVLELAGRDKLFRRAMRLVNRRAYSRGGLKRKLLKYSEDVDALEAVLDRLESLGVLDDERYAEALVREVQRTRPAGPKLLRQKLRMKGVPDAVVERVLAATRDETQQVAAATKLASRRAAAMRRLDAATRKRRLWGMLARRGFEHEVIVAALDAVLGDGAEDGGV